jgi:hypothetical protein
MRSLILRTTALAALLAISASACAADDEPPGTGPDDPIGTPFPPGPTPPEPSPQVVEPREGLVEVRPRPWEEVEVLGPRRLRVLFWSGVEECYGLDRVEVEESDEDVTITLFEGRVPEAEVCIEIAVAKAVDVRLEARLGDRAIADGAPRGE